MPDTGMNSTSLSLLFTVVLKKPNGRYGQFHHVCVETEAWRWKCPLEFQ